MAGREGLFLAFLDPGLGLFQHRAQAAEGRLVQALPVEEIQLPLQAGRLRCPADGLGADDAFRRVFREQLRDRLHAGDRRQRAGAGGDPAHVV